MYFVVLAWVLLLAVGGGRAQSVELHPNCGQVNTVRMSSTSSVLATLRAYAFATSCFGYQFVSNDGTCTPSTAGYVNLTITQSNGATTSIRMTDLYRGSVLSSSLRFSTATTFTVTAYYPDTSCAATLYYSLYGTYSVQPPTSSTIAPYLVSDSPTYMVPGQTLQFNFEVLNPPSPALSNNSQRILLLPEGLLCSSNAASAYVQTGSPSITVTSATTFTWSTSATVNGMYRVCSWNSQDQQWFAAAIIQLFGGNPAYFKQTTTSSNRGTQTVTLTFSGYNLSPSTDSVVLLADDGTACQTGIKSDASITLNSLSTVDATHIAASISIALRNAPSSYVVCYYAASSKAWTSVPDFDTLTRDVIGNFSSTVTAAPTTAPATSMPLTTPAPAPAAGTPTTPSPPTPAPTLATPSPPASCPTAPYNSANIAVTTNQVVAVVVSGSSIPSTFATQVASFLCVTSSAIAITRFDSGDSTSTVYFQVQCSAAGNTCNSAERQAAFLAYYSTASLTSVQSASSQTFSGISVAAAADNNVKATQIGLGVGLGVAVVLLIIALVVLGVFIKRRRARAARGEDEDEAHVVQGRVIEVNPVLNYPYPTPRRSTTNDDPYAASPIPALPEKTASAAMASAPRQDTDERDL